MSARWHNAVIALTRLEQVTSWVVGKQGVGPKTALWEITPVKSGCRQEPVAWPPLAPIPETDSPPVYRPGTAPRAVPAGKGCALPSSLPGAIAPAKR